MPDELDLPTYLTQNNIKKHTGSHNLLSSWVLCANLYFPFRTEEGRDLLRRFLAATVGVEIAEVQAIELEFEGEGELKPAVLLRESMGSRGSGQTSPDVAFIVQTGKGPGIFLVESKYTEHLFYDCSGFKTRETHGRAPNPNRARCLSFSRVLSAPESECHLVEGWHRRYWEYLRPRVNQVEAVSYFSGCPASHGAYQLFRQQALAEGFISSRKYAFVASVVAYDARNTSLFIIAGRAGPLDLRDVWPRLFRGAAFKTFTHQSWVYWVRKHDNSRAWSEWSNYIADRYRM